jgi:Uncharacterized conserved protein
MEAANEREHTLDPRVRWRWAMRGIGPVLAIAAVATAAVWVARVPVPPAIMTAGLLVVGGGLVWALVRLRYRRWRYRLDPDGLTLTHGVLTHVRTVVPYTRIQHVDTRRGPLDRLLGLGAVVVYTAGTRGADVTIPGLSTREAGVMQERLRDASERTAGEDAV